MQRKALVIGINSYRNAPLRSCVNDAEQIGQVLSMEKEYGFEVQYLIEGDATRRAILRELKNQLTLESEFFVFYFAGHGHVDSFDRTFLIPFDTDEIDIGIDLEEIARLLIKSKPKIVIMLLDCCHSGAANIRAHSDKKIRYARIQDFDQNLNGLGSGKIVIAACKPEQLSYEEPDLNHGVFTYYLIEGLLGEAADNQGLLSIGALYDYITKNFKQRTQQTPVFKGDFAGEIHISQNLEPREQAFVPEEELSNIGRKAKQMMNEYLKSLVPDLEVRRQYKYREDCDNLLPILQWFDRKLKTHPQLNKKREFRFAHEEARSKLSELGQLGEGYNTKVGKIVKHIGSGTFGRVWQVEDEDMNNLYAYKVYHPNDLGNMDKIKRFNRGYRAMQQLDHPHIVKVYQFTEVPIGFLMTFIDGSNLREFAFLDHPPEDKLQQLITIAETLKHAHSRGVIHRDVKPENIIMKYEEKQGQYKPFLTDFDLAWFSTETRFTQEALGSLYYASPEQLSNPNSNAAHRETTDIYAFGQLIYYFICKQDPSSMSNLIHVLEDRLGNWPRVEPAKMIADLYKSCTAQSHTKRLQDFREVSDRLFEAKKLLESSDHSKIFDFDTFCKELIFSIIGILEERKTSGRRFYTISGKLSISISREPNERVAFTFAAQDTPIMEGLNYKNTRESLNQRIDSILNNYPHVKHMAGNQGAFEFFIYINRVSMNIDGVEMCRPILTRIIDVIEPYIP